MRKRSWVAGERGGKGGWSGKREREEPHYSLAERAKKKETKKRLKKRGPSGWTG